MDFFQKSMCWFDDLQIELEDEAIREWSGDWRLQTARNSVENSVGIRWERSLTTMLRCGQGRDHTILYGIHKPGESHPDTSYYVILKITLIRCQSYFRCLTFTSTSHPTTCSFETMLKRQ